MCPMSDRNATQRGAGNLGLKIVGCAAAVVFVLLFLICAGGGAGYYFWYKPKADEAAKEKEYQELRSCLYSCLVVVSRHENDATGCPEQIQR